MDKKINQNILNALNHNIRRKILRMLAIKELTFSELLDEVDVSSSHFTYHLDALGELVIKKDSKYSLSKYGQVAIKMMDTLETPSLKYRLYTNIWHYVSLASIIIILILGNLVIQYDNTVEEQNTIIESIKIKNEEYIQEIDELLFYSSLNDLLNTNTSYSHIMINNEHIMEYNGKQESNLVTYIYASKNNVILKADFSQNNESTVIFFTVQKGAPINKTDIIVIDGNSTKTIEKLPNVWSQMITNHAQDYNIILPTKGWYTVSIIGPVGIKNDTPIIINNMNNTQIQNPALVKLQIGELDNNRVFIYCIPQIKNE